MPKKPPKLRKGDRANFNTLMEAGHNRDLALVSAIRKSDGKAVALVCAVNYARHPDTSAVNYKLAPLAVMIEGDPFELFEDPTKTCKRKSPSEPSSN